VSAGRAPSLQRFDHADTSARSSRRPTAGIRRHANFCPPRTFPALVALEPSGEQRVVEAPDALREVLGDGLAEIARRLEAERDLLNKLDAAGVSEPLRVPEGISLAAPAANPPVQPTATPVS
jgi:hypothetical protein